MWKILLIGTVCFTLANGQCDNACPCHVQTSLATNTDAQQKQNRASTLTTEKTYNSTTSQQFNSTVSGQQNNHNVKFDKESTNGAKPFNPEPPHISGSSFVPQPAARSIPSEMFSSGLFQLMSAARKNQNLLLSPMSLQTVLTFIFTISEGKLAEELANILQLPQNRSYVARKFQALLKNPYNSNENNTLIMANKLYYEQRFGLLTPSVRLIANQFFSSDVESIDFLAPQQASRTINLWIANQTRNLIQEIVTPNVLRADTRAILINSLYFKSEWLQKFSPHDTEKQSFYLNQLQQVPVDMMYIEEVFPYGEFHELKAKVVELAYKLDDFRMMIILPNEIDDLPNVERRLSQVSLKSISDRLQNSEVTIRLPQFKIEFESELVPILQQMGLYSLFNEDAKIRLFKNQHKPIQVDQIKQKTFISVNEAGTEAAAVTFAKFVPLSIPLRIKQFTVDRPFIFAIRNSKALYFVGHVAHF